jgi:hypothetical protein
MTLMAPRRVGRTVRGIRDSIPSGHIIGRASSGEGPAEMIPLSNLAAGLAGNGLIITPSNLSQQFDILFGSSEGDILQRGPVLWQVLAPGTANQLLTSGGASALNSWKSLSALLDAAFGSTRGMVLYRGASGWAALNAGVTGYFLQTQFTTGDPQWFQLITGVPLSGNLTKWASPNTLTNGDLSGDVTTAGTLATTIAANAVTTTKINAAAVTTAKIADANVTLAKIASAAASSKLLGSGASGSGAPYSELSLGTGLSMSGTTLNASGSSSIINAYGPIYPTSIYPVDTTGRLFPQFAPIVTVLGKVRGMAVKASLDADAIWRLSFQLPPFFPTGTMKLVLRGNAPATSGVAKVTPSWAKVGDGVDISGVSLSAETQQSYTWSVSNSNLTNKVTLTSPPSAGDENKMILMDLTFNTTSWTLAQISVWTAFLIWE